MASIAFPGFDRIITDPAILEGRPCVRGLRLSVGRVLAILALQPSGKDLKADYPELEEEDIRQVLAFAAHSVDDRLMPESAA